MSGDAAVLLNGSDDVDLPKVTIESLLSSVLNCSTHESCYFNANSTGEEIMTLIGKYCNTTQVYAVRDRCCMSQIKVDETDRRLLNTVMNLWLMGLFGMIGVISNILAAVVLSHPRISNTTTSLYLRALAVSDLSLCFVVTMFCLADFGNIPEELLIAYIRSIPYLSVLPHVSRLNSIFLVIAVTVERYIAVCHPLQAKRFCTLRNCRIVITVAIVAAMAANLPRLFFLEHSFCFGDETNLMSDFFVNHLTHLLYNVVFEAAMYCIFPFAILSLFNILLIRSIRQSVHFKRGSNKSSHEDNQRQLTVMLVVVVAAFVICQIPAVIYAVFVRPLVLHDPSLRKSNEFVIFIDQIRNFPVMLNSALNFWLYCAAGKKFRQVFLMIFCSRRQLEKGELTTATAVKSRVGTRVYRGTTRQSAENNSSGSGSLLSSSSRCRVNNKSAASKSFSNTQPDSSLISEVVNQTIPESPAECNDT